MLAHVFRPANYVPSPVTSVCSNNTTVAAFKRNGMVQFINSLTLRKYLEYQIFEEVIQSFFIDLNTIVALCKSKKVLILDIKTLETSSLAIDAICISAEFNDVELAPRVFLYATSKNELFMYKDGKATPVLSIKSKITAILKYNAYILIGTSDGWVSFISNNKIVTEVEIKTTPTCICAIDNNNYAITGFDGKVFLLNPISEIIMDSVQIRSHPLTAMAVVNDCIHVSGVDSRILLLKFANNKLIKQFQGDAHYTEVLTMCSDNGRAVSSGEDGIVLFSTNTNEKYVFQLVYDQSMVTGSTKDYFFTAYNNSLDLYALDDSKTTEIKQSESEMTSAQTQDSQMISDLISFKMSKETLGKINQEQTLFSHFCRIKTNMNIIAADVSFDQRFACVSTSNKTNFYSLFTGSKLRIEILKTFAPSKWIKFTDKKLVLQGLDKKITVFDLESFEADVFTFADFSEKLQVCNENIVLFDSKKIYDLDSKSLLDLENPQLSSLITSKIMATSSSKDAVYCVSEDDKGPVVIEIKNNKEIKYTPVISQCDVSLKDNYTFMNLQHFYSSNILANERFLFVLKEDKVATYDIGILIIGVVSYKDSIVVIQQPYKKLALTFKRSVFKEKYGNR